MDAMNKYLSKFQGLSTEKDKLVKQLEEELAEKQVALNTTTTERNALAKESELALQVLREHGFHHQLVGQRDSTFQGTIKQLMKERKESRAAIQQLQNKVSEHAAERERLSQEREKLSKEKQSFQENVSEMMCFNNS